MLPNHHAPLSLYDQELQARAMLATKIRQFPLHDLTLAVVNGILFLESYEDFNGAQRKEILVDTIVEEMQKSGHVGLYMVPQLVDIIIDVSDHGLPINTHKRTTCWCKSLLCCIPCFSQRSQGGILRVW